MTRRVVILGATGSVGAQTLEVIRAHPDRFTVAGLAAGSDVQALARAASEFGVDHLAVADRQAAAGLRELLPQAEVRDGPEGVTELAGLPEADVVVNAVVGARGLQPTLAALKAGHRLALANKESLVIAGELAVTAAGGDRDRIVPVDSEHSALAQCLRGGRREEVARLVLSASGGPFRGHSRTDLAGVTPEQALAHPTWEMGPVITINSATLMNKGLELIEAHYLFAVPFDALEVVVHPQSVVHSLVEFVDGSTLAQLSPPDMRLPIQLALSWPDRLPRAFARMDWTQARELTFEPADRQAFPALELAEEAGRRGGTAPAVLNAANEEAVAAFLDGRIGFLDISATVADVLEAHTPTRPSRLEEVLQADAWARRRAGQVLTDQGAART